VFGELYNVGGESREGRGIYTLLKHGEVSCRI